MFLTVHRAAVQPDRWCGEAAEEPAFSSLLHSERIPDQPGEPAAQAGHQQGGVPALHRLRQGKVGRFGLPCLLFFPLSSTHPPRDLDRSAAVMLTLAHMLLFFLIYLCSFQLEQQSLSTLRQMFRQMSHKKTIKITLRLLALVSLPATVQRGFCQESLLTLLLSKGTNQATMVPCLSNVWLQKLIETGNTVSFVT